MNTTTYRKGDHVLVTDPNTGRTEKGVVESVNAEGSLYIEGPPLPQDSRITAWEVSAERAKTAVRPDPAFQPIDYTAPGCICRLGGMGRRSDCPVHGEQ